MSGPLLHTYPLILLMQIMNQMHRLSMESGCLSEYDGMSVSQLACVAYLSFSGDAPVYQRDLEECFKLRRSTISSLLTALERKGLLCRVPVSHDARLRRLVLTEKGQSLGGQILERFAQLNGILVDCLDPEEQETLGRILKKMTRHLSARCP